MKGGNICYSPRGKKSLVQRHLLGNERYDLSVSLCHYCHLKQCLHQGASLVAQMVNNLPAMQETQVQSLGREDPLEKGMATHSIIITGTVP